jgi:hypothetical protein
MNRRQQTEAEAFLRSNEYAATRVPDFTHQPPSKVDLKFGAARDRLTQAIADLGGKQAIQAGGAFGAETAHQAVLRGELEEELKDVNTTAAAIAEETANHALMDRFRLPYGASDRDLVASTRAMAAAIRELGLNDEFEAHGHPPDTAADLDQLAADFDLKEGEQGVALGDRAGATDAIPATLRAGRAAVKTLNAIFRRIFKGNPEVLTAWKTASHVLRAARAPVPGAAPVTPPPP